MPRGNPGEGRVSVLCPRCGMGMVTWNKKGICGKCQGKIYKNVDTNKKFKIPTKGKR